MPPIRRRQTASISVLFMVVMIDLENLAAYEKYRKKRAADAEAKEIVEFAINLAASWSSVKRNWNE